MVDAAGTSRFTYTSNGDLSSEVQPWTSATVTYGYDPSVPHLRKSLSLSQPTGNWTNGLAYDAARRLSTLTSQAGTFTYSYFAGSGGGASSSLPKKIALPNNSYVTNAYDSVARLLDTGLKNSGRYFTYDDEDQLASVQVPGYFYSLFTYDGLGRLRQRLDYSWNGTSWVSSATKRCLYDGRCVIQERDGSNNPTVSYTRGSDLSGTREGAGGIGGMLARSHGYSAGTWSTHHFYHADGNGNITAMADSSQLISATYKYDSYGYLLTYSGSMASANLYRFSGKNGTPGTPTPASTTSASAGPSPTCRGGLIGTRSPSMMAQTYSASFTTGLRIRWILSVTRIGTGPPPRSSSALEVPPSPSRIADSGA